MNENLLEYKNQILQKNYEVISEVEGAISFNNEDYRTCVILLGEYDEKSKLAKQLHEELDGKFNYAEKSTICVILDAKDLDKDTIRRDPYYYLKIFVEDINILPNKIDMGITIELVPAMSMEEMDGDYNIDPFQFHEAVACVNYYRFLAQVTENSVVKYPPILGLSGVSWYRYITNKFFNIEFKKPE